MKFECCEVAMVVNNFGVKGPTDERSLVCLRNREISLVGGGAGPRSAAQLFLTLCNLMDCSLLGSSVHGIFQARILKWVAISSREDEYQEGKLCELSLETWAVARSCKTERPNFSVQVAQSLVGRQTCKQMLTLPFSMINALIAQVISEHRRPVLPSET